MAAVNEPAGQTAVVHEAGDAPPPKQEVNLNTLIFFKMITAYHKHHFRITVGAQAV
jgi:hypothetical protein